METKKKQRIQIENQTEKKVQQQEVTKSEKETEKP